MSAQDKFHIPVYYLLSHPPVRKSGTSVIVDRSGQLIQLPGCATGLTQQNICYGMYAR